MQLILGIDIAQIEIFERSVLIHMKDGKTIECYSEDKIETKKYDF